MSPRFLTSILLAALLTACTVESDTSGGDLPSVTPTPSPSLTALPSATPPGVLPSLRFEEPADGAILAGNFEVDLALGDDAGNVETVELVVTELGTGSETRITLQAPYAYAIDGADYEDGRLELRAVAASAGTVLASAVVEVTIDNTGPFIALLEPAAGSLVLSTTTVRADVVDPAELAEVRLSLRGEDNEVEVASFLERPFVADLDPAALGAVAGFGDALLVMHATDTVGNASVLEHSIFIDDGPPRVSILEPDADARLEGPFTLRLAVDEGSRLESLRILVNGAEVAQLLGPARQTELDPADFDPGTKLIEAVAVDGAGLEGRASRVFTFLGPAPGAEPDRAWVVDSLVLGASGEGFDLDGDGLPDNAGTGILANTLFADAFGDVDVLLQREIDSGGLRMVFATDDLDPAEAGVPASDTFLWLDFVLAEDLDEPRDPTDDFSGNEVFAPAEGSLDEDGEPNISFPGATLTDGLLSAGPGDFLFVLPLLTPPPEILLQEARIEATLTQDGLSEGLIGGAMPVARLTEIVSSIPGAEEYASLIQLLLPSYSDIDLDADGEPDAISLALRFTAVNAALELPAPVEPPP